MWQVSTGGDKDERRAKGYSTNTDDVLENQRKCRAKAEGAKCEKRERATPSLFVGLRVVVVVIVIIKGYLVTGRLRKPMPLRLRA